MAKCFNCGAEIEEGKSYCDKCSEMENNAYLDELLSGIVDREENEMAQAFDIEPIDDNNVKALDDNAEPVVFIPSEDEVPKNDTNTLENVKNKKKKAKPKKEKPVKEKKEKPVKEKKEKPEKEKKEKKSFMASLGDIFFESDEEIAQKAEQEKQTINDINLFDDPALENNTNDDTKGKKGKKGKKSKKKNKEKEGQEENEDKKKKKEKKPKKAKKEKKEKQELNPDELVRFSPVKIVLFVLFVLSVVLFVVVWTEAFSYHNNVETARKYYKEGNYTSAYDKLSGMELRDDEKRLYSQLRTLMTLEKQINSYYNFKRMNMELDALDSLFKCVYNYNEHLDNAKKLDVYEEYRVIYEKALKILKDDYRISEEDATYYSNISIYEQYLQILKNYGGTNDDSND